LSQRGLEAIFSAMQPASVLADPVLVRLRQLLEQAYGPRLERIVLFGSRARGEARPDSDYDVAVFLHDMTDREEELDLLAPFQTRVIDEMDAFVHVIPFGPGAWHERSPLMSEIRAEGRDV
jgi:predicted nucleotidyltransferase